MEKGTIEVKTDNIFPIIKKFLYSDHEIFLRELISNAMDATKKIKKLAAIGDFKGDLGDLTVEVILDADAKTLTVTDRGIGMTADEVKKYITQIAFSSAEEFIKKYQGRGKDAQIIGHFGMGFYSSFMVSEKVEIFTKSYKKSSSVIWSCDGSPDYTIDKGDSEGRGTSVVLHINEESNEFLEKDRVHNLLLKYCRFLPTKIKFDGNVINNTKPAWIKKPASLTDQNYLDFYKELYPVSEDPLFWVHLNVDYPFNLTGILYFPRFKQDIEFQKNKIQLFSNQVFVTDSVDNIVPEFLMLLHGVLDSPDIPLNVSRSFLQNDPNVKKINSHITKKVADKLEKLRKDDASAFEEKWDDIQVFIKYGMLTDDKFFDRAKKFFLYKNNAGKYFGMDAYLKHIKEKQTDKDEKTVIIYTDNPQEQHTFIESAKKRKYDVLEFTEVIDPHFISMLETKLENVRLVRVDADTIDKLVDKGRKKTSKLTEKDQEKLKPLIEKEINQTGVAILFEALSEKDHPMVITKPEFTRRMKDMAASGGPNYMGDLPDSYNLVVNTNNPLITKIMLEPKKEHQGRLIKQLYDLALVSQNMLKGKDLTAFIERSMDLIED